MKYYYCYTTTYHNNTKIGTNISHGMKREIPENQIIDLNWDNVDWYYGTNGLDFKFVLSETKKGKKISFFTNKMLFVNKDERDIKEWKNKDLNIRIEKIYKEVEPSIDTILKWHDNASAVEYLNERGLKISQ